MSAPGVLDPTDIYNNPLIPEQDVTWTGTFVTPKVTNLADGEALSYPNAPEPSSCVDFNDKNKWASQIVVNGVRQGTTWNDHYAGWGTFAVNDGGHYRSQHVAFSFKEVFGFEGGTTSNISAKITGNQPYAGGFESPLIPVMPGDEIKSGSSLPAGQPAAGVC